MPFRVIAACLLALTFSTAYADDADPCSKQCDAGERLVSFTDGNYVTCSCTLASQMDPTVPDPEVGGTGEEEDEGEK